MKKTTLLIFILSFIYTFGVAQNSDLQNINNQDGVSTPAPTPTFSPALTVVGETVCCGDSWNPQANTFDYEISLTHNTFMYGADWTFTVTDGLITHVDGTQLYQPVSGYVINTGNTWSHTITINWDDEPGVGNLWVQVQWGWIPFTTGERHLNLPVFVGAPPKPTYISASNNSPYVGETISLSTNLCEGATEYSTLWGTTNGTIDSHDVNVAYTPSSGGNSTVTVHATNVCGSSPTKSRNFYINQYPPLDVYITGPIYGYEGIYYTWTANPSGGLQPYSYDWYYSYDNVNFNSLNSYSSTITIQLPYGYEWLYLKVVVTDDLEDSDYDVFDVWNKSFSSNADSKSGSKLVIENDKYKSSAELSENMHVGLITSGENLSPNPTTGIVNIPQLFQKKYERLKIYDSFGKLIFKSDKVKPSIDLTGFVNGIYVACFINGSESKNIKISKR